MSDLNNQNSDADMAGIFDDAAFNSVQFDNYSNADSPFDASRFFNLNAADSPDFQPRTPSKGFLEQDATAALQNQQYPTRPQLSSRSVESSSQDSSSESSDRRKRKTTSESPPTTNMAGLHVKQEMQNDGMETENVHNLQNFGRSLNNLSLDQDMMSQNMDMGNAFDFDSAASSPGAIDSGIGAFNPHTGLKNVAMRPGPPAGTIEPAQFFMGSSGASPSSAQANTTAEGSPAMFPNTTPSSAAPDVFTNNQMWGTTGETPGWSNNYDNSFASPGALGLTPSPVANTSAAAAGRGASIVEDGLIPLHIGAIPAKSRVETQINIRMTIERLPPGVHNLHLPTHTIAKAKLLSKDIPAAEETLELHTMLVCTSAMNQPKSRENALKKAAAQDNAEIQAKGISAVDKKEPEEDEEDDKPASGGEVRICQNCINRERKRAARKKLKKEEEQAHWEKYETERVIVFNTNEYKAWLDWQPSPPPKDGSLSAVPSDLYAPSDSAMQITAPMRIACYCRHQNEKDGFQVIFTLKDYTGKVVAQALSDSILITDDHKTHPMAAMAGQVWYDGQFPPPGYGSQSMVDLHSHMPNMPISKSTGNLHAMSFGPGGFHHSSNVHQMPGYASQTTSGTMTPKTLSRPASPTGLGQSGPSKKRKSSSSAPHRRVPSGLTMTKVDTSQPMTSGAMTGTPFSPTSNPNFTPGVDNPGFMNMSQNSRTSFHTQPPTPSDSAPFYRNLNRTTSLDQNGFQAFYSAPNSAHQSRAASPVLSGPNLAAFQRQHGRPNPFSLSQGNPTSAPSQTPAPQADEKPAPIINKVVPSEGPTSGGMEVSIYGQNFVPGMEVVFGDRTATATTYWGEKALCCVLPPSSTLGPVHVSIAGRSNAGNRLSGISGMGPGQATFRYTPEQSDTRMMEMALRFYSLKMTGTEDNWQSTARDAADMWMNAAQGGPETMGGTVPGAFPG
ncbi:hypothetical protein BDZ85DRAFT_259750 [Elsinoe ampelina]|uniref:IPT/TIG domain-containing protein n=1 Tax=Elsinoe ampelina TaxID=302913 RepID=A0A6A6GHM2_9PEZI|nr:hypothetical protein BDZ85DRAFT_259750 [Elsinoe ampelina]